MDTINIPPQSLSGGPRTGSAPTSPDAPTTAPEGTAVPFAELARLGHHSWQRHLVGLAVILFCWFVVGSMATLSLMELFATFGPPPLAGYLVVNAPFPFLLAGLLIAVRFVHHRPVRSLVTTRRRVDARRIAASFGLYLLLALAATLIEAGLDPSRFRLTLSVGWLLTLPVIVAVTCLQTTTEELFFRGYLLQATGLLTRRTWLLVALNTILFAVPHLMNPELTSNSPVLAAAYFFLGAFFTILTLRDNRLELALGAHAANNLVAALVVNHPNSSLPTQAIWEVRDLNPHYILPSFLLCAAVYFWAMLSRTHRSPPPA